MGVWRDTAGEVKWLARLLVILGKMSGGKVREGKLDKEDEPYSDSAQSQNGDFL